MAGGGTGGHLYPALAIADKIMRRDAQSEILFVGAKKEVSTGIIESNGYRLEQIDARGFDRKHILRNAGVLKDLAAASLQVRRILKGFAPDVVIGTGGYVSGPVIREASKRGIPTFVHEQNVIPGMSNRLAARYADEVFLAFPQSRAHFRGGKGSAEFTVTGNPVRRAFLMAGAMNYREKLGVQPGETALLIFGGSQGAERINEVVSDFLIDQKDSGSMKVFFLTGRSQYYEILNRLDSAGVTADGRVRVIDYTEAIHEYYAAADLIIARSGALTVSEIAACGRASILIPSPNVTNNHQYHNAKVLADAGAALLMEEKDLSVETLTGVILKLAANKPQINHMAECAAKTAHTDASEVIYARIAERLGQTGGQRA
jgi:UDP-N-acetylglucosamine--N-acetylmuramyl-(pentapeptide) pyrophosphoryl-undecaprenol N-acetylglucosamine transferase